ncbi:MAG: DUF488 family protein [Gammaproteobacteria bacterium]|nr:DUF488 family protein [Gammaproteobacteria bacterium]NIR96930.1 DUF488 family protein [Gammaproteobacteria bacterium]NIT62632.1 DUF488 family protein [Gammaproteobacteria bacterium]NIV19592.1 DUF488 family protein [Gammaproteobacteria bacterium]NIX10812.1 DUF488 family protein [Gammaproteobacteria bacterium]
MQIHLKRVYDGPGSKDGVRVLVDRVWPRGVSKDEARVDRWMKDLAPSTELRKWFGHDPDRWAGFRERYFRELDRRPEAVEALRELGTGRRVTLVFGARDRQRNNAVALKEYLQRR